MVSILLSNSSLIDCSGMGHAVGCSNRQSKDRYELPGMTTTHSLLIQDTWAWQSRQIGWSLMGDERSDSTDRGAVDPWLWCQYQPLALQPTGAR